MKRTYNKLVRDRIPEIIEKNGEKAVFKTLDGDDFLNCLFEKAREELLEVETAETLDETKKELADLLEVVRTIAKHKGYSLSDIIEEADRKASERGGFSGRIYLVDVSDDIGI